MLPLISLAASFLGGGKGKLILYSVLALTILGGGLYVKSWVNTKNESIEILTKDLQAKQGELIALNQALQTVQESSNQKDSVIKGLVADRKLQAESIGVLKNELEKTNVSVDKYKSRLNRITTAPNADIGPYIRDALYGIKELEMGETNVK